jgi:membrane protease YdiL (CAAX protease family)
VRRDSDANEEDTPAQTLKHLDDADANSMQARDKGKNKKRNRKKNKTQMAEQAQNEQAQDEQAQNGQVQNELTQNEQSQNELTQNEPPGEVVLEGRNNYMHPVLRIWRIIYPVLIHYVTALLMVIAFTAYFVLRASGEGQAADPSALAEQVIRSSLYQLIPTSLIAGGICFLFYRRDEKRRKAGFLGRGAGFVWDPPVIWFSVVVLAVAGSQLLNDLINVLDLYKLFPSYAELTNETMAGQPVWLLILTVGVLAPIAEELVFRGLIFHRMKDWMNPVLAIILSSVIFGLYHGNMIQFIYATLLGMILAVVYHRTGTLWIAILAHISANLWSLCASGWWNAFTRNIPYGIFAGLLLEVLLCVIPAYWIFVKNRKINK